MLYLYELLQNNIRPNDGMESLVLYLVDKIVAVMIDYNQMMIVVAFTS
jgi:hypothetical protein